MEPQIAELLRSERYARTAASLQSTLAAVGADLRAPDESRRLRGARELSTLARAELSWMKLPVRAFFVSAATCRDLEDALDASTSQTRIALLIAIKNAYERYVVHPMWREVHQESDATAWSSWLQLLGGRFMMGPDLMLRAEAAYLLALSGDERAWQVYLEIVPRRSALLGHLEFAILRCPDSRTPEMRAALVDLADDVERRHPKQAHTASDVRSALART